MDGTGERGGDATTNGTDVVDLVGSDEWLAVVGHFERIRDRHLREFFEADPSRGNAMTATAGSTSITLVPGGLLRVQQRRSTQACIQVGVKQHDNLNSSVKSDGVTRPL